MNPPGPEKFKTHTLRPFSASQTALTRTGCCSKLAASVPISIGTICEATVAELQFGREEISHQAEGKVCDSPLRLNKHTN